MSCFFTLVSVTLIVLDTSRNSQSVGARLQAKGVLASARQNGPLRPAQASAVMRPLTSRFLFLSFRRQMRGSERPLTRHHASGLKSAQDPVDSTCYQGRTFYSPSLPLATSAPKHRLEGPPLPRTQVTLLKPLSRTARHSTRNS